MKYLELSIRDFNGSFTQKAKAFGVLVQIVQKVPLWKITVVRLTAASNFEITEFLKSLISTKLSHWTWETLAMHANAIKPVVSNAPHWKNRTLMENRAS